MAKGTGFLQPRDKHLDITVSTESTFATQLADMADLGGT